MRHRITANAYEQLTEHHRPAYPQYTEADFMRFCLNELPRACALKAVRVYEKNIGGGILKTDCDFQVTNASEDALSYILNENRHHHDHEARGLLKLTSDTTMPWTFEEIEREWFGDAHLAWDEGDVVRAFDLAEQLAGRDWVLGNEVDPALACAFPGIGRRGGYQEFLRVYWFGKRAASIVGARGADAFIQRLIANDPSTSEEASAIHLLRAGNPDTELEVAPTIAVGTRNRQPDFRIRKPPEEWVYVEVTALNQSTASVQTLALLQRVAERVISVDAPFLLEIVLSRDPTPSEEEQVMTEAEIACREAQGHQRDIADVASILVKAGDPQVVIPSLIENDGRPRMAVSRALIGPGQPNRQMIARIPFQDQRAEDTLRIEARQLPRNECGVVMVNVNRQPTAFESWSLRVPERFAGGQHTRIAAVVLFMHATIPTNEGLAWLPFLRVIPNPRATKPLPPWVVETLTKRYSFGNASSTGREDPGVTAIDTGLRLNR